LFDADKLENLVMADWSFVFSSFSY